MSWWADIPVVVLTEDELWRNVMSWWADIPVVEITTTTTTNSNCVFFGFFLLYM